MLAVGARAAAVAVLVLAACSSGGAGNGAGGAVPTNVTCAASPHGCRCQSSPFSLDADEQPVHDCDSPAGLSCCYDLDSNGETTACECESLVCTGTDDACDCAFEGGGVSGTVYAPSECTATSAGAYDYPVTGVCCTQPSSCHCDDMGGACYYGSATSSCATPPLVRSCANFGPDNLDGHDVRTSCQGVTWRAF